MNTAQKLREKGFTLIELLVVIAVLGILAAVVLVAINPTERINEATDAGTKNNVSQVATALESCFTNEEGDYDPCVNGSDATDLSDLKSKGYLKQTTGLTDSEDKGVQVSEVGTTDEFTISGKLTGKSNQPGGQTCTTYYWVYKTSDGSSDSSCKRDGTN